MLRIINGILILFLLSFSTVTAQTKLLFVGNEIKKNIYINAHFIVNNSDSLVLNQTVLQRDIDYRFNQKFKRFELLIKHDSEFDSLTVQYRQLPSWLQQRYGKALPEVTPQTKTSTIIFPSGNYKKHRTESDMKLSGSKSFRLTSSQTGSTGFNQTLDLNLSGHLAKNLTLQGTISDRGYNPSYGTSNSRLNELDKINIKIASPNFSAQIGDIIIESNKSFRVREKKISGINLSVHNKNMQIGMIAARPKGRYNSVSFFGQNNKQGPYQIKSQSVRQAIIPSSETVWLDGIQLKRGANDDYTLDYPNGQITFNVNNLIDVRSRIVIDYEPLSSEYKQEYLHASSGFNSTDSVYKFSFNWIREGDDKDENLSQSFSSADEQLLANTLGEELIFKSGIISDTLGSYQILSDSLPDTVYQFVGENAGQYDVRFSYIDSGKGDYVYRGANRYQYVGYGKGDFLPVILLNTPKRTDYLGGAFVLTDDKIGQLQTEWNQSRKINNLFAVDNSSDNNNYYRFAYTKLFGTSKNKVSALYRKKDFKYSERNRVNQADYTYQYYLPIQSKFNSAEQLTSVNSVINIFSSFTIQSGYSLLNYSNQFQSKNSKVALKFSPLKKLKFLGDANIIRADLLNTSQKQQGRSDIVNIQGDYNFYKNYTLTSSFAKTKRSNDYSLLVGGFSHDEYTIRIADKNSEILYQYYTEDTLSLVWEKKKNRKRIQFKSENKIKKLNYTLHVRYQELDNLTNKQTSLLTLANFIYTNRKQNLQIQTSYTLSDETRFSKGIRYLEVNNGEGDYIFSDSQYIPEVGGNYILVEELLSETAPVKRGEKSFSLSKRWDKVYVTFNSFISEELFASESRSRKWIFPVFSDSKLSYLFFNRFLKGSLKAFPISGGYFFTLNFSEKKEKRFINQQDRLKESLKSEFIFNQKIENIFIEERLELFQDERDAYYFREGDINGLALVGKVKQVTDKNEYGVQVKYRRAVSADSKISQIYMFLLENRFKIQKHGELKVSSEFYRSNKNDIVSSQSYLLTDNRPGRQGVIWSLIFRAKLKNEFRLNFTLQGRHSDINEARIFARTEFIAQF